MEPKHICNICNKTFTRKYSLDNHIASHRGQTGYLCEICKVRICRKRPHSCAVENGVCECYVCGLKFSSSKAMFRHRNLAHPVQMPITEEELSQNTAPPKSIENPAIIPFPSIMAHVIDNILKKTLFLRAEEEEEKEEEHLIEFKNHPALRHFQLTEGTVVSYDDIIYLKCPLCLDSYDSFEGFKDHIDSYPFLPSSQKDEFFDAVSEIIADMSTCYFSPDPDELSSEFTNNNK